MTQELLAMRVSVLLRSATEVASAVTALVASRQAVKDTQGALGAAVLRTSSLPGIANYGPLIDALKSIKDGLERNDDTGREAIEQVLRLINTLQDGLPNLTKTIGQASDGLKRLVDRYIPFGDKWEDLVVESADNLSKKVNTLGDDINQGSKALPDLWQTYYDEVLPAADQLFSEYIDLLGGVSIRERGLSIGSLQEVCHLDEFCRMVDLLVTRELQQCVRLPAGPTLTLPGRETIRVGPSWPIVRLSFAYWSIWGMALEGHEFGVVLANKLVDKDWKDELAAFGRQGLRLLVADTIGAWAEGPAYACALCLLGLDPRQVVGDHEGAHVTAADRAHVVDLCLTEQIAAKLSSGQAGLTPEQANYGHGYLEFVSGITMRWHTALKGAGRPPSNRGALLANLPQRVRTTFSLDRPFGIDDWDLAKDVWSALEQEESLPIESMVGSVIGIRHLMNAAWYARCTENVAHGLDPNEIERRALAAAYKEFIQPKGSGERSRPRGSEQVGEQLKRDAGATKGGME